MFPILRNQMLVYSAVLMFRESTYETGIQDGSNISDANAETDGCITRSGFGIPKNDPDDPEQPIRPRTTHCSKGWAAYRKTTHTTQNNPYDPLK